jgi:hypothetical protein
MEVFFLNKGGREKIAWHMELWDKGCLMGGHKWGEDTGLKRATPEPS